MSERKKTRWYFYRQGTGYVYESTKTKRYNVFSIWLHVLAVTPRLCHVLF
jgi:hypothetical protein